MPLPAAMANQAPTKKQFEAQTTWMRNPQWLAIRTRRIKQ